MRQNCEITPYLICINGFSIPVQKSNLHVPNYPRVRTAIGQDSDHDDIRTVLGNIKCQFGA